jgi:hypothetical protein
MTIEGGCFCGAVRYRAISAPIASSICHCQTCRQISSAPLVPWVTFARQEFAFIRGEPATLQSSQDVVRTFCVHCGTPLSYTNKSTADEIDIATCSLDDPNAYPPTHHSWTSDGLTWMQIANDLPRFAKSKQDAQNHRSA